MRGTHKITASHLERLALIYLRQSSMAQVRENTESTARQYALADEAVGLGWPRSQVEVIDADLGLSGRSAANRSGFKDLVGRVCLGEVGAIFGLEVSRLARSSADLSRLLELARLSDTLIVDADGIYDLSDINDHLILGVKNQMSEAELRFLASRLQGAKQAAAERGELRIGLPVGYVYDEKAASSWTLTPRSKRRSPTSSAPSVREDQPFRWWSRSRIASFPRGPMAACGTASCAGASSLIRES